MLSWVRFPSSISSPVTRKLTIWPVHLVPAIGAYISVFGSTEGGHDLISVRKLNNKLLPPADDSTWPLPHLHAAFRAWWLAEYSGFYLDDPPESAVPPNTDLDEGKRSPTRKSLYICIKLLSHDRGPSSFEAVSRFAQGWRIRFSALSRGRR